MELIEFLELFDSHHLPVYRFALRLTGRVADAEDIVQECFLSLLRPESAYTPERGPLRSYLFGVAWKQFLKRGSRRESTVELPPEPAGHFTPECEALQAELRDAVMRAVSQLSEAQRVVLILAYYEQMGLAEIAELLEVDVGAVKMRLQRARAQLKESLAVYAPVRKEMS